METVNQIKMSGIHDVQIHFLFLSHIEMIILIYIYCGIESMIRAFEEEEYLNHINLVKREK